MSDVSGFKTTNGFFEYKIINSTGDVKYDGEEYLNEIHAAFERWDSLFKSSPYDDWKLNVNLQLTELDSTKYDVDLNGIGETSESTFHSIETDESLKFGSVFPTSATLKLNKNKLDDMFQTPSSVEYGDSAPFSKRTLIYEVVLSELSHCLGISKIAFTSEDIFNKKVVKYTDADDGKDKYYYNGENALENINHILWKRVMTLLEYH